VNVLVEVLRNRNRRREFGVGHHEHVGVVDAGLFECGPVRVWRSLHVVSLRVDGTGDVVVVGAGDDDVHCCGGGWGRVCVF